MCFQHPPFDETDANAVESERGELGSASDPPLAYKALTSAFVVGADQGSDTNTCGECFEENRDGTP